MTRKDRLAAVARREEEARRIREADQEIRSGIPEVEPRPISDTGTPRQRRGGVQHR